MTLVLRPLNSKDAEAFFEGLSLFSDMERFWFTLLWEEGISFEEHLKTLEERERGINVPRDRVPDSILYAFLDGKIIGRLNIRHELNEYLVSRGGHIGYAVATAYRHKGYGEEILRQGLVYCSENLGLKKIMLTCSEENIGSYKIIEKVNPFSMEKVFYDDAWIRKYWIEIK